MNVYFFKTTILFEDYSVENSQDRTKRSSMMKCIIRSSVSPLALISSDAFFFYERILKGETALRIIV